LAFVEPGCKNFGDEIIVLRELGAEERFAVVPQGMEA
jgi:hypothetical protein